MKPNILFLLAMFLIASVVVIGCKKDIVEPDDTNLTNDIKPGVRHYFTSASYGDIIAFTIDGNNSTYSFVNETTGETGSGSLTLASDPKLRGIYETTIGGKKLYTIELPGVAVISTLPLGNTKNRICFGVSSDIHHENNYSISDFKGRYLFFNFDDEEKDPDYFLGGYETFVDGSYTWGFANASLTSVNFLGMGYGTFDFIEGDNSRLQFVEYDGQIGIGSIYPGKLFVTDNGEGNGFTVGVEYPSTPISQSQIAGNYKMVSVTTHSGESVGYFSLPASGKGITYYEKLNDGTVYDSEEEGNIIDSFKRLEGFNNLFEVILTVDDDWQLKTYLLLLPGEVMMFFSTEPGGMIDAYGLALKIN